MLFTAIKSQEAVAWICFLVGVVLVLSGAAIGLYLSFKKTPNAVTEKVEEAKAKAKETEAEITKAQGGGLEAAGADPAKAAQEVKTKLDQIGDLVGSLPEHLRFAGVLVLVGTVLMSVATVQFGGTSLF